MAYKRTGNMVEIGARFMAPNMAAAIIAMEMAVAVEGEEW